MQMTQRSVGDVTVLDLELATTGDYSRQLFRGHIQSLLTEGHRKLVLNCAQLRWINSINLGLLVAAHRTVEGEGGRVVIAQANERISDLMKIVGMNKVWDIYSTEAEAVGSFGLRGQA